MNDLIHAYVVKKVVSTSYNPVDRAIFIAEGTAQSKDAPWQRRLPAMKISKPFNLDTFSQLSVLDARGRRHPLASFWHEQRAALVFVRHFG